MSMIAKKIALFVGTVAILFALVSVMDSTKVYADPGDPLESVEVGYHTSGGGGASVYLNSSKPYYVNESHEATSDSTVDWNAYYDAANGILYYNNYDGVGVDIRSTRGWLKIVLIGENKIECKSQFGIYIQDDLTISSSTGGKLLIKTGTDAYCPGIESNYGSVVIAGDADVSIDVHSEGNNSVYGVLARKGLIKITDDSKLSIKTQSSYQYGYSSGFYGKQLWIDTPNAITYTGTCCSNDGYALSGFESIYMGNGASIDIDLNCLNDNCYFSNEPSLRKMLATCNYRLKKTLESENHHKGVIDPKEYVSQYINITYDDSDFSTLIPDMTGKEVSQKFLESFTSPHGETLPSDNQGWYIRLKDITGFADDPGDYQNLKNSTEPLERGETYYYVFEVVLNDDLYMWNPDQGKYFMFNGSLKRHEYSDYVDDDGLTCFIVDFSDICMEDMSSGTIQDIPDGVYCEDYYMPVPVVEYKGNLLTKHSDYVYYYLDEEGTYIYGPSEAGEYTLVVSGNGSYFGEITKSFKILPADLSAAEVSGIETDYSYTGSPIKPVPKITVKLNGNDTDLYEGTDYEVTYSNNTKAGTAVVTIRGIGNYTGTVTRSFKINRIDQTITASDINKKSDDAPFDLGATCSGDGVLSYSSDNTNVVTVDSSGKVTIKGAGKAKITITASETGAYNKAVKTVNVTITFVAPTSTPKPTAKPTAAADVKLSLDKKALSVVCGKTVSLKATLKGSKDKITWKSSNTKIATVDSKGEVTAKMAGAVTITASAAGKKAECKVTVLYKDVTNSKDFWFAPTNYLTAKGVVKGYDNQTKFKPANECTRAQMVTFIWRLQGEPAPKATTCKFKDVKKTDYFYKACIWGNENHIVEGYKDGTFGPQIVCARKHAVTFLWRLANKPSPKSKENKFKDVKEKDYFYKACLWASEKGILAGYSDGTFKPDGDCLRRQMVTFLYKYDKFVNGKG